MVAVKLFRRVRKLFEAMGFYPPPPPNQKCEFNVENVFYIAKNTWMFIPLTGFLIYKAKSYYEYSLSFYMNVVVLTMAVFCAVMIYKMGSIVKLIESFEEFVKNRKHEQHRKLGVLTTKLNFGKFNFSRNRNGI